MVLTKGFRRAAGTLVALVLVVPALGAQSRGSLLDVGVSDVRSGAPIVGAEVVVPELKLLRRTDSLGRTIIAGIPHATYRVRVRLIGYAPSEVSLRIAGDTTGVVFRLERVAVSLAGVDVTAGAVPMHLREFEIRRNQGIGRFLTEDELGRDANRDFVSVATTRFPGLMMRTDSDGRPHIASTRSSCGGTTPDGRGSRGIERLGGRVPSATRGGGPSDGGGAPENKLSGSCTSTRPCLVKIYLDDVELGEADDGLIRSWDLSGVEYYTGASMPARYRVSGSACGVLLLWSKWR